MHSSKVSTTISQKIRIFSGNGWSISVRKVSRRVAQSADEFGYNIVRDPIHVHDFQATILHLMGLDHEQRVFKHQGRRYRLTDVEGRVVREILACRLMPSDELIGGN